MDIPIASPPVDAHGRPTLDAARLVEVLDGVSVLFYVQDPDGRITYVNHAGCELVGRPPRRSSGGCRRSSSTR